MKSLNTTYLEGYVGQDVKTHKFGNGDLKASFSLATSESWKDEAGERQNKTTWHNVGIYAQGLAEVAPEFIKKGSHLLVVGELTYRDREKDGVKFRDTEVAVRGNGGMVRLLDKKPSGPS